MWRAVSATLKLARIWPAETRSARSIYSEALKFLVQNIAEARRRAPRK